MTARDVTDAHLPLQLFAGYTEADTAIFAEFLNLDAKPEPGFVVDFMGSKIRTSSVWEHARTLDGQVLGVPVPADFHAETIEWLGLLKAVRGATDQYVAMELGAGFGPWVIAGGVAARRRGIEKIRLYAVEGDAKHYQFLRQHFLDNGFEPDRHWLFEAAVGVSAGVAQWPVVGDSVASEEWGCRPMETSSDYMGRQFSKTRPIDIIPMRDLVLRESRWDLIHLDIQGHEVEICRSCLDELNTRVRRIVAATHSRKIDGDLLELMCKNAWILEHEKPAKFTFVAGAATLEAMTTIDGTQVWRNPRLVQGGDPLNSFAQEFACSVRQLTLQGGGGHILDIYVTNTGTQPWYGNAQEAPVRASYRWLDAAGNMLPIEGNRTLLSRPVLQPGESDRLQLHVVAPPSRGSYMLCISMVQEGVAWFNDRGANPLILTEVHVF